ncbi:MAG: glycine cleavage system aminomethyltransferase GcvT [Verrucomicrobia bacterium]|nr:glycine cleavage system aminomethyltransferase GcvT [Verrucomicrobiota bacterium]
MRLKRTPLFETHARLGARLIEFGGWEMPVLYTGILEEHLAVRRAAGVFDISHMGEIQVIGAGAESFLNQILTNDVRTLSVGQGQYTLLCNPAGGVVDDLYVFRVDDEEYLLIVNASRVGADWDWLQGQLDTTAITEVIRLKDVSSAYGGIAVQGPRVAEFVNDVFSGGALRGALVPRVTDLRKNQIGIFLFNGVSVFVSRTGYTGEDGFEIIASAESIAALWDRVMAVGQAAGTRPAGLGARDTLRTEMGYPLYGQDLSETITPMEAGLGGFVAMDKGEFVGRAVLAAQQGGTMGRRAVAFQVTAKGPPPRPHYAIWSAGPDARALGHVSSGTQSPSLNCGIGMGFVPPSHAAVGTALDIEIRGQRVPAVVVRKPIYRKPV